MKSGSGAVATRERSEGCPPPVVTPDLFRGPPFRVLNSLEYADGWMPERARHDGEG